MKTISRYIMTLALLLTAVTGAWAEETLLTTVTATGQTTYSQTPDGVVTVSLNNIAYSDANYGWLYGGTVTVEAPQGYTITQCVFWSYDGTPLTDNMAPFTATIVDGGEGPSYVSTGQAVSYMDGIKFIEVYGTAPAPIEVTPVAGKTNEWTFEMPAFDVVLTPIYAKAAAFATTGTEPDVKTLLPTAIEGIFAGTTDAIVKAGTVAMMGKTENPQGIVMYAVTSINQATAPELSAFSADVPTAENIADEGADVLIWYYIQGANTPDGQEATAENTFNDSEICAEPIKVTVLPNKYDINFNAANANTIEAGKATVTVGGTDKTVTEGKLQGVKMGTKVTINAKQGYKFRKVEVKKGGAATLATALENGATVVIAFKYRDDGTCTFTNNNGTFTFVSGTGQLGGGNGPKQLSVENGKLIFKGSGTNSFTDRWSWYGFQVTFDPTANTYEVWKGSDLDVASFTSISVNGTDITDQLSELK